MLAGMEASKDGQTLPFGIRKRVVAAVESGGLSCNQAAKQFGIGISTAIGWVNRLHQGVEELAVSSPLEDEI
jgi:hypothetical protein